MQQQWRELEERDAASERDAQQEESRLLSFDPMLAAAAATGGVECHPGQFGPHLAPLARSEARRRAEAHFPTEDGEDRTRLLRTRENPFRPLLAGGAGASFSPKELDAHLRKLRENVGARIAAAGRLLDSRDQRYLAMKNELVEQSLERRQREEELVNWSYVLKYLLSTNSRLRQELRQMQSERARAGSRGTAEHPSPNAADGGAPRNSAGPHLRLAEGGKTRRPRQPERRQLPWASSAGAARSGNGGGGSGQAGGAVPSPSLFSDSDDDDFSQLDG